MEEKQTSWMSVVGYLLLFLAAAVGLYLFISMGQSGTLKDAAYWAKRARAAKKRKANERAQQQFNELNQAA
jgi:hypothetical protein